MLLIGIAMVDVRHHTMSMYAPAHEPIIAPDPEELQRGIVIVQRGMMVKENVALATCEPYYYFPEVFKPVTEFKNKFFKQPFVKPIIFYCIRNNC
jgi:hypothetical protein